MLNTQTSETLATSVCRAEKPTDLPETSSKSSTPVLRNRPSRTKSDVTFQFSYWNELLSVSFCYERLSVLKGAESKTGGVQTANKESSPIPAERQHSITFNASPASEVSL